MCFKASSLNYVSCALDKPVEICCGAQCCKIALTMVSPIAARFAKAGVFGLILFQGLAAPFAKALDAAPAFGFPLARIVPPLSADACTEIDAVFHAPGHIAQDGLRASGKPFPAFDFFLRRQGLEFAPGFQIRSNRALVAVGQGDDPGIGRNFGEVEDGRDDFHKLSLVRHCHWRNRNNSGRD